MTAFDAVGETWNDGNPLDGFLEACQEVVASDDDPQHLGAVASVLAMQVVHTNEGAQLKTRARRKVDNSIAELRSWAPHLMCGLSAMEEMLDLDAQQSPHLLDDFDNRKRYVLDTYIQHMWLFMLDYHRATDETVFTEQYAQSIIRRCEYIPVRVPWLVAGWLGYYHEGNYLRIMQALGKADPSHLAKAIKWWEFAISCEHAQDAMQDKAMAGYQAKLTEYKKAAPTVTASTTEAAPKAKGSNGCLVFAVPFLGLSALAAKHFLNL